MKITDFSVKNYQFTLIVFVMLAAIGVNSLLNMPRGEDPDIQAPTFSTIVIYPGTSPKDMEELVVDPIEKKIQRDGRCETHRIPDRRWPGGHTARIQI